MIFQHITELASGNLGNAQELYVKCGNKIKIVQFFFKQGGAEQPLGSTLQNLVKMIKKSTISFYYQFSKKELVKFDLQNMKIIMCTATHKN